MSTVEVKLYKRQDNTGFVKVRLRSKTSAGAISYKDIDLDSVNSEAGMARAVNVAAGALAEHQAKMYGDNHDPVECSRLASEAFKEMMAQAKQSG